MMLVPYELEGEFTSKDFAKAAGIKRELAATTLNVLSYIGITKKTAKEDVKIYTQSQMIERIMFDEDKKTALCIFERSASYDKYSYDECGGV